MTGSSLKRAAIPFLASASILGADVPGADYFESKIRPLLVEQCYACHSEGNAAPQAGLRVDSREALLKGGKSGPALRPGEPESSLLVQMVRGAGGLRMPPTGKLTDAQIGHFEEWVRVGAPFPSGEESADERPPPESHWAFLPPRKSAPPASPSAWGSDAIDRFVEARLSEEDLRPSAEASPETLLRRVHFDLTGLPPEPSVADAFAADPTPKAYEAVVDSLLASERFGQRWARHWLDVARYSDEGFQARPFPISWTYRDWVVDAFNDDLPYDEFARLQLAADLVSDDKGHLPALGMLTVGINMVRPTELPDNIDDRIDVVTRGFLGLSVACARCHDHKFDPIPQTDYYALYGVFLNSPYVLEPVPTERVESGSEADFFREKLYLRRSWLDTYRAERLADHVGEFRKPDVLAKYLEVGWEARDLENRAVEALAKERNLNHYLLERWRIYLRDLVGPAVQVFAALDTPGAAASLAARMAEADSVYRWPDIEREVLRLALRGNGSPTDIPVEDFWWIQNEGDSNVMKGLKWQYDAVMHEWSYRGGPRHAMVVRDAERPLPSYVFLRGNQHDKGEEVPPRFLSALPGHGEFRNGSGRLDLARAITSEENPLFARVYVNRVWGHLFGEGIVRTPSDFGMRGDPPTHAALLDHLAAEFMADGWSTKNLVRRIALSETYRQASAERADGRRVDPSNRLLWRQNRRRLDFEALRDSMLAVAGRLDTTVGGPPFQLRATPSSPRRTLYAYVSREEPSALMRTFDFSNPEEHTPRRQLTTVPQQALFLMNSSFLAEQARALAASCDEAQPEACVDRLYRRTLGRDAEPPVRREAEAFLASPASAPPASAGPTAGAWAYGTAELDPESGTIRSFRPMKYRVEDRLQPAPALATRDSGRASLTSAGGYPGDDLRSAVARRWTAPRAMRVAVTGTLNHPMGDQATRFSHSNGLRGWIVSSERGTLATWTVRGYEVETGLRNIRVAKGERLDFVVDSLGDYESDAFGWAPEIEEILSGEQRDAGIEPQSWSADQDFPDPREEPLTPLEQYAQVLLMANEFAFRD